MPKKPSTARTLVTFLLDRTGSMQSIKDDTIGAFNAYLKGLRESGEAIDLTLVQFDSQSIDKTCVRTPVGAVPELTDATYQPRASTPLVDAAYKTIKAVEKQVAEEKGTKVVICIQTDGHENASTEYSFTGLNVLIKEKTALGWQFNFMGAGIDAYDQGARMGIVAAATMSYDKTSRAATNSAFTARASATAAFASGARADMSISNAERHAAGDRFVDRQPRANTLPLATPTAKRETRKIVDDITL